MKLLLARHTQSEHNVSGVCSGSVGEIDQLTCDGIIQAHELAQKLDREKLSVLYSSEFCRATQVANIIASRHSIAVKKDERLNENNTGFSTHPKQAWLDALNSGDDVWNAKFHDGESMNEARDRSLDALRDITDQHKNDDTVLIVTHSFVAQAMLNYLKKRPKDFQAKDEIPMGGYSWLDLSLPRLDASAHGVVQ